MLFYLLAFPALAMGMTILAVKTTTIYVPALEPGTEIPKGLQGSVVTADSQATTVALACGPKVSSDACTFYDSVTITYGPSTAGFFYKQAPTDPRNTYGDVETMACSLVDTDASCTWDVTQVFNNINYNSKEYFVYSNYPDKRIEVTLTAS